MTVRELRIGDVFRVVGDRKLWRKASQSLVRPPGRPWSAPTDLSAFTGKEIEVVERAETAEVRRSENTLVLRGGEVTLEFHGPWKVLSCTPKEKFTEFVLAGSFISASVAKKPSEDTALAFAVTAGGKHLNRPRGSDVLAYRGRVYGRATNREVLGRYSPGSYLRKRMIDGKQHIAIAAILCIPDEYALYDIITELFGPDAK